MKITVLGSGGWGTALALLLVDNGNAVTLWSHREAEAEHLRQSRENSLLKGVALPEALEISSSLDSVGDALLRGPGDGPENRAHAAAGRGGGVGGQGH